MADGNPGWYASRLAHRPLTGPHLLGGSMHQTMTSSPSAPARRPLATALLVALMAPGLAFAQTAR